MRDLSRRLGVAMLIITHNLGVVARYATRPVNVMYADVILERHGRGSLCNPRHPTPSGDCCLFRPAPDTRGARAPRPDRGSSGRNLTACREGARSGRAAGNRVERCVETPPLVQLDGTGHCAACWEAANIASASQVTV